MVCVLGDLVENPGGILRAYCNAVDIPYSDSMLTWSPGPVPEWGPIETREPGTILSYTVLYNTILYYRI